jgi:hypothetical protein
MLRHSPASNLSPRLLSKISSVRHLPAAYHLAANNLILSTGGRYSPEYNRWALTSDAGAPVGRGYHTAIWDGGMPPDEWRGGYRDPMECRDI